MKPEMNKERMTGKTRRNRHAHSAQEKSLAVLSVWAEKRRAGTVCRELGISWGVLNQWEKRALQGMLQGLGHREEKTEQSVSLCKRLERLILGEEHPASVEASASGESSTP